MAAKPVQISLDAEILERIDADPEARAQGRSAFVRSAILRYFAAKARRDTDRAIAAAYGKAAGAAAAEVADLIDAQQWPDD
jgi:metal-responsive CopG/Arc/MetJ family transcriptional regulator